MKTGPILQHLALRIDLTFPWMAGTPPEMMGRAVAIAIKALPLMKLEIERHTLRGFVAVPADVSLPEFEKRVQAVRDELERDLEPAEYKAMLARRRAEFSLVEDPAPPAVQPSQP